MRTIVNKREAAIISACTGISFGSAHVSEFHKYVEEKFNRPVYTHEMSGEDFWSKLKKLSMTDFLKLAQHMK